MAVNDSFAGAEQDIDEQRARALATVAQFGRRGLEESAAQARRSGDVSDSVTQANRETGNAVRASGAGRAELDAISAAGNDAYGADAAGRTALLEGELGAGAQVDANYFNQARETVPALRSNAQSVQEQYRRAYEQRQADVAAQAALDMQMRQQAALQNQMITQQMEQARLEEERRVEQARQLAIALNPYTRMFNLGQGTGMDPRIVRNIPNLTPGQRRLLES